MPLHRDGYEPVAAFSHETAKTGALGAHHKRRRQGVIDLIVTFLRVAREPDRPDTRLFQLFDRTGDVHDVRDLHVRHRPGGRLGRRAAKRRCMALLPHDARRTSRFDGRSSSPASTRFTVTPAVRAAPTMSATRASTRCDTRIASTRPARKASSTGLMP